VRVIVLLLALLLSGLPRAAGAVTVDEANREQKRAAQKTFEAADELYRAERYDEALTAFRASYDIVSSANTRLMLARCLRALERLIEAREEFLGTIADAEASPERYVQALEAARAELGSLNERLAFVTINPSGEATVRLNDRELRREELAVALPLVPEKVVIVATWKSGLTTQRELDLTPGAYENIELHEPAPAPPPAPPAKRPTAPVAPPRSDEPGPPRTLAYVAGGVGLAGLATFTIFGLMNNAKYDSLEEACTAGRCPADRVDDIDTGRTYQTVANVGLAVGVVGLGAGVTLFVLSRDSGSEAVSARITPSSVTIGGAF
jgi:hypothetical protein